MGAMRGELKVRTILVAATLILAGSLAGCGSGGVRDEAKPESEASVGTVEHYSAQFSGALADSDLAAAAQVLDEMELNHPFSLTTHKHMLEMADAYKADGRSAESMNLAQRFVRMFPSHKDVDYALYIAGSAGYEDAVDALQPEVESPDPEQARASLEFFKALQLRHPTSRYVSEARNSASNLESLLARYELRLMVYELDRGNTELAQEMGNELIRRYPQSGAAARARGLLGMGPGPKRDLPKPIDESVDNPVAGPAIEPQIEEAPSAVVDEAASEKMVAAMATALASAPVSEVPTFEVEPEPAPAPEPVAAPVVVPVVESRRIESEPVVPVADEGGEPIPDSDLVVQEDSFGIQVARNQHLPTLKAEVAEMGMAGDVYYIEYADQQGVNWHAAIYGNFINIRSAETVLAGLQAKFGDQVQLQNVTDLSMEERAPEKVVAVSVAKSLARSSDDLIYVIQVASSRQHDLLKYDIAKLGLREEDIRYYTYNVNGLEWHAALYGEYATPDHANSKLDIMKAVAHDDKVWVRPISAADLSRGHSLSAVGTVKKRDRKAVRVDQLYAIQISSSLDLKRLKKDINALGLKGKVFYRQWIDENGEQRFSVHYGSYNGVDEARPDMERIRRITGRQDIWIRPLEGEENL